MSSMFERTTKELVKEIGDRELRPVKCLVSATKIRRFSLIRRKKARSRFWELPDVPLDASLMDIFEPGSSVPDAAVEVPALFSDTEVRKHQVAGSMKAGAKVGFSEESAACRGSSLEYKIVSTPHETWTELQKRKLPDPEPYFLRQCREAGVNLYVVTDTVELLNSPVLQDHSSVKVSGICSIPWNIFVKGFCLQSKGQGRSLQVKEKKLTVPKDSVVAYKRKQLVFHSRGWGIHHIADDNDDRETFPAGGMEPPRFRMSGMEPPRFRMSDMEPAIPRIGIHHIADDNDDRETFRAGDMELAIPQMGDMEPAIPQMADLGPIIFKVDFKLLQEEVSQNVKAAELSKDMQNIVFSNLLAMLGDHEALQDLMDKLEQEPFGHLDGPGGTILTELRKDSRYPEVGSKCLILYLLEALMVLSDIQHVLLAQSMKKRILLPQRDLVRSILEPNFNCFQKIPFTLQPELLAPLQEEDLAITYGLLGKCGLKMKRKSPRSTWDPEAKEPLSALYGALSVLSQLAEARAHLGAGRESVQ